MSQQQDFPAGESFPEVPPIKVRASSSPSAAVTVSTPLATDTPTAGAARKIGIAVDLSDESAYAVKWAVDHYLRPGDAVVLLHVRPTSVLYGADWGCVDMSPRAAAANAEGRAFAESQQKLEDDFDAFTCSKTADLAQPLIDAKVPHKIHIVKDHDMKERLCLEVERLGFNAVIMGSRGFGATRRGSNGRLGSVSDYCVRHCVCPVVVVRYPDEKDGVNDPNAMVTVAETEEEEEYHDVSAQDKVDV